MRGDFPPGGLKAHKTRPGYLTELTELKEFPEQNFVNSVNSVQLPAGAGTAALTVLIGSPEAVPSVAASPVTRLASRFCDHGAFELVRGAAGADRDDGFACVRGEAERRTA